MHLEVHKPDDVYNNEKCWDDKIVDTVFHKRPAQRGDKRKPETIHDVTAHVKYHDETSRGKTHDEKRTQSNVSHVLRIKKEIGRSEPRLKITKNEIKEEAPINQEHVVFFDQQHQELDREGKNYTACFSGKHSGK